MRAADVTSTPTGFGAPQRPRRTSGPRRFASLRAIGALMLREMAATHGRTPGGYLWAVLEPVFGVMVLTAAFSMLFMQPPIGNSFELFYATGMLPFMLSLTLINRTGTALMASKALLSYPAVTFVDALIARFLVNFITEVLVCYLVITAVLVIFDTRAILDLGRVAQALLVAGFFGFSFGTLNAYLFMRFHMWHVVWAVISRPLFLISGVVFLFHWLPKMVQDYLWFNPFIHMIGMMRAGFYPSYDDGYVSVLYVTSLSLLCLFTGLLLLRKNINRLLYEG